jgi:hypothetical protein
MPKRLVAFLRSVAAGTNLTFNVLVGQVTVNSSPLQATLGTISAVISGLAGGMVAGTVASKLPFLNAVGVLILLAIDTASVFAKGPGPVLFDLAGSCILGLAVLAGGWIIAAPRSRFCGSARCLIQLRIARIDLDTAGLILSSN